MIAEHVRRAVPLRAVELRVPVLRRALPAASASTRNAPGHGGQAASGRRERGPTAHRGLPDADGARCSTRRSLFGLTGGLAYAWFRRRAASEFTWLGSPRRGRARRDRARERGVVLRRRGTQRAKCASALFVLAASLVASWLFVVAAGTTAAPLRPCCIKAAQVTDIVALVAGLLSLQTSYIVVGTRLRREAERHGREDGAGPRRALAAQPGGLRHVRGLAAR